MDISVYMARNSDGNIVRRLKVKRGTSLVMQWLKICAPNTGDLSSIPGQRTKSHMVQ